MLILKDLLLWALVLVHVVGMAFLFRRIFPRDSRWLGFVFPEVLFVLLGNFVEHHVARAELRLCCRGLCSLFQVTFTQRRKGRNG